MKLRIYAIEASGNYGGGMAVVAAKSKRTAIKLAATIKDEWKCRYGEPDKVTLLDAESEGDPRILTHYEIGE